MTQELKIKYRNITNFKLLSNIDKLLMDSAVEVLHSAYAPYSEFNVGAAVLLGNNKIIVGNNQENSSFPCGVCAERVALSTASVNYPNISIKKIAITANAKHFNLTEPVGPCGLCRQVLLEHEDRQADNIELLLFNKDKVIKLDKAKDLLPFYFQETQLKRL